MEDIRWFENVVKNSSDSLWRMGQISRVLQDYRKDIQYQWDDNASKELNLRYLNPHEDEDRKMMNLFQLHEEILKQLIHCISQIHEKFLELNQLWSDLERIKIKIRDEIKNAYANYDLYKENYSKSENLLPVIDDLIEKANSAIRP